MNVTLPAFNFSLEHMIGISSSGLAGLYVSDNVQTSGLGLPFSDMVPEYNMFPLSDTPKDPVSLSRPGSVHRPPHVLLPLFSSHPHSTCEAEKEERLNQ